MLPTCVRRTKTLTRDDASRYTSGRMWDTLLKPIINYLSRRLETGEVNRETSKRRRHRLEAHLTFVDNWSESFQLFGMPAPMPIDRVTTALRLEFGARRFRSAIGGAKPVTEQDLLEGRVSYLLLGDPGAGKTTTLKRVARRLVRARLSEQSVRCPIVLRIRDLEMEQPSVVRAIADLLAIEYKPAPDSDDDEVDTVHYVGVERLDHVIADVVSTIDAVLLIDGLDEASPPTQRSILKEIVLLARAIRAGKIIVSCRAADYVWEAEGLQVVSIEPLTSRQINEIADHWLADRSVRFREALADAAYADVVDRPLLLSQLLFLYDRAGYLPDQQTAIYKKLTNLLLYAWDEQRGIHRATAYAGFEPEQKAEFLACLAYYLTYRVRTRVFAEADLIRSYNAIHQRFGLPAGEATAVAREIESHSGIIAEAFGRYEFAHLSLQEYLCAEYIVREPFPEFIDGYLAEYPAPLAIAVALSSYPAMWLSNLILHNVPDRFTESNVASFLSRLLLERPVLSNHVTVGVALLRLLSSYRGKASSVPSLVEQVIERFDLEVSLTWALAWYVVDASASAAAEAVVLERNPDAGAQLPEHFPSRLQIRRSYFRELLNHVDAAMSFRDATGELRPLIGTEPFLFMSE